MSFLKSFSQFPIADKVTCLLIFRLSFPPVFHQADLPIAEKYAYIPTYVVSIDTEYQLFTVQVFYSFIRRLLQTVLTELPIIISFY